VSAAPLGWLGQACFALRFLVQWHAAERAGRSVAPRSFWWLSLAGALLMALYTSEARQLVLAGGFLASAWIYARNLLLRGGADPRALTRLLPETAAVLGILAWCFAAGVADARSAGLPRVWLAILVTGQLLWTARFALQWLASERSGRSHLPRSFWWLSLAGNALLLAYALFLADPLLIAAFAFGPFVQVRNLVLGERPREAVPEVGLPADPPRVAHR